MEKDEYSRNQVKEINEECRTNWHPANNHRQRNKPSAQELLLTQKLVHPGIIEEAPLVIMGWQYCKSCFDLIAEVICDECFGEKETTTKCPHLTWQPQADPFRQRCDWCYYQLYLYALTRERNGRSGNTCEKCQKISNKRMITYQDDSIMIICEDCQRERITELIREIFAAASAQIDEDVRAASEEGYIDE